VDSAPFQVLQDIEYYNRNGGMNKQLYDTTLQVGMAKECYSMKLDLLTNSTVVDDAVRFLL